MKKTSTLSFLILFFFTFAFAERPDTASDSHTPCIAQSPGFGSVINRIGYAGEMISEVYFEVAPTPADVRKDGIGYWVRHPNYKPDGAPTVLDFVSNDNRAVRKAIKEKKPLVIMATLSKNEHDEWAVTTREEALIHIPPLKK
ncbi:MAG: hypothetical protein JWM20_967 [Patescibacteria group bacterium]|nr:hypothetical protein [Patescibacteria group bacterium]